MPTSTITSYPFLGDLYSRSGPGSARLVPDRPGRLSHAPAYSPKYDYTFDHTYTSTASSGSSNSAPPKLWCEFCDLLGCTAQFDVNDEDAWITHHRQHLEHSSTPSPSQPSRSRHFPTDLLCWFCDTRSFYIDDPSLRTTDRLANFLLRMQHIRMHILNDDLRDPTPVAATPDRRTHTSRMHASHPSPSSGSLHRRCTSAAMRPDFGIIKLLRAIGRLNDAQYRRALAMTELPRRFRLPGWTDDDALGGDDANNDDGDKYLRSSRSIERRGGEMAVVEVAESRPGRGRRPGRQQQQRRF